MGREMPNIGQICRYPHRYRWCMRSTFKNSCNDHEPSRRPIFLLRDYSKNIAHRKSRAPCVASAVVPSQSRDAFAKSTDLTHIDMIEGDGNGYQQGN
jgi:hypothetical protein